MIDFEALIIEHQADIKFKVQKAYPKIKKPTHLDPDDLEQEIYVFVLDCFRRWFDPEKASARTFMNRCINCCLYDVIQKSWRNVDSQRFSVVDDDDGDEVSAQDIVPDDLDTQALSELILSLDAFSSPELEYMSVFLDPPDGILTTPRRFRTGVRRHLGLTEDQERVLRDQIELKLTQLRSQR